ncbi:MAG TPA: peptide ABC transporter substrate-binding protein [Candidatus Baltobacteraceae bacterium]|nr:peptide ABC transporter substrate-binding protein [Candidatus Baltobacteraceae bacterium]
MRDGLLRALVAGALSAALPLAAAACTKSSSAGHAGARNPWTRPGELVIGSAGEEPDSLNEMFAHTDATDQIANLIDEPIFRYDPNGEYLPAAVREVPTLANGGISRDGKTIVLHFRPGMRWSDGAPYDARDFVFTWRAAMNPRNNVKLRAGWDDIAAIGVSADHLTATVRLKHVYASILGTWAYGGAAYPPLPAHLLANLPDINHAAYNARPISSGPFVLTRWNHGSSLEFAPNPYYWRGKPGLQRIVYKIVPDANTLFDQLETHEVDVYESIPDAQVPRLRTLRGYAITKRLTANYRRLAFNTSKPALSDVRVRLAVAEAVDWDRINRTIYHGYNLRAASDILPTSWAAPVGIRPYPHDVANAKRLLDAAGWRTGAHGDRSRDGVPLTFSVSTTPSKPANVQAELEMQQDLAAAGIRLQIKNYQTNLLFAMNGPIYTGRFDSEFTIDTNAPDPDNEGLWSGAFIPPRGANTTWLNDPVLTRTSHEALLTFDRAKRKALYQREAERIHQLVPVVYLYWQNSFSAVNSDLKNWKPASYISNYWNCWEWRI